MRINQGQLVSLGYGRFVRSDDVIAIEPITQGRGPGRRAFVWVRGVEQPLVASRSEEALAAELVSPAQDGQRSKLERDLLQRVVTTVDEIPGALRRRLKQSDGIDLDGLAQEAARLIA